DLPLIGPLFAATFGKLIKRDRYMHEDEWRGPGNSVRASEKGFGERYATELGESPGGLPISPGKASQVFGEQMYRFQEQIGFPGFIASSFKERLTGSQEFFDQTPQLESAGRIGSIERDIWDRELGGF